MWRTLLIIGLLLLIGAGAGTAWWWYNYYHAVPSEELILYGNIDLRQIQLAFNNNERIVNVEVVEGDTVKKGQLLAQLDRSRLKPQVDNMKALSDAQWEVYQKLKNGSRPQEIGQAEAKVNSAKADAANAKRQYDRLQKLAVVRLRDKSEVRGASQEEVDNAKAAWEVAEAKLVEQEQTLELVRVGPRKEEIGEAEARFQASAAQLAYLRQQLADTNLVAPEDAVVRTRLMEPGEMASPQRPVFSLAIIKTKWVRTYVSETDLGKVKDHMPASIAVDSFPSRRFEGWVGFISPVAEFTPKPVQTEELRTSLVYEVRVFVHDPNNELRLGMPATVYLANGEAVAPVEPNSSPRLQRR